MVHVRWYCDSVQLYTHISKLLYVHQVQMKSWYVWMWLGTQGAYWFDNWVCYHNQVISVASICYVQFTNETNIVTLKYCVVCILTVAMRQTCLVSNNLLLFDSDICIYLHDYVVCILTLLSGWSLQKYKCFFQSMRQVMHYQHLICAKFESDHDMVGVVALRLFTSIVI